jgi:NADH:ubiquinone oxidoreductase subunit 6 (subunit J)
MFKPLLDTVLQSYLFISIVLGFVASFLNKQTQQLPQLSELNVEYGQGISQLKTLLYGDFSLFLIFSTVVLLVALLGAAVMTRNKR